jgi:hypothetical protein
MPAGGVEFDSMISRRWSDKEWGLGKKFRFEVIKVEEFAGLAYKN